LLNGDEKMEIKVTVNTRICYWQGHELRELYYGDFNGIIRCQEGTPPPEIHFIQGYVDPAKYYISIIFFQPVFLDNQPDSISGLPVIFIYPTPKD
jgi:hypothetical protein